ncbi:MAG: tRNA 4-thiouridine(8) synthase ThiI [Oscillospiraceae bacterium]|nr:tRNA 4-thiouridine(8) synthase ThiI [Oscillospiraceae bacterium]
MNDIILCKLGEIVLKGLNRKIFENKLMGNMRRRLAPIGQFKVYCLQSTIYVEAEEENADMDAAFEALRQVFGIIKLSRAAGCDKDKDAIAALAVDYLRDEMLQAKSFKVESKRSDKSFPMTSIELSQYIGGALQEAYPATRVDVHDPELTVHVEIRDLAAYVHASPVDGAGGMPVGSNGTAVTLLSGGIDSPVSTYMIARRGVRLIPIHFFSFPYTSQAAKEKVVELGRLLTAYCGRMTLEVVPFTHIQEEIRDKCPEEYFTLIMRRFMMRIATRIAKDNGAKAIVTGENLGQVASQTMEAMASTQAVTPLPTLQPLVGMDKEEIVQWARRIGTFDTSILPYEDCCTVFTPRHPRTRPKLSEVEAVEAALDVTALVDEALAGIERIRLDEQEDA